MKWLNVIFSHSITFFKIEIDFQDKFEKEFFEVKNKNFEFDSIHSQLEKEIFDLKNKSLRCEERYAKLEETVVHLNNETLNLDSNHSKLNKEFVDLKRTKVFIVKQVLPKLKKKLII